jgi:diadenosine tetraphosphatase ApaH/serine/threonine PP2A family protein phosphatase
VGHTHLPCAIEEDLKTFRPEDDAGSYTLGEKKVIINVGSVGQPRDGDNRACYVTFDGKVVTYHRVPYDYQRTREKIEAVPELDNRLGARLVEGY